MTSKELNLHLQKTLGMSLKQAKERKKFLNIAAGHPWTSPETRKKHIEELKKLSELGI